MSCDYERQKSRIIKEEGRSGDWKRRALARLEREIGAEEVRRENRRVGIETSSGRVICKKKGFRTLEAAEAALEQIPLSAMQAEKAPVRAYCCCFCGKFHLTSRS